MAGLRIRRGQRRTEGERLLEYGFREFQEYRLFEPGAPVAEADVWQGVAPKVPLVVDGHGGDHPLARGAQGAGGEARAIASPVPAPVVAGQEVGRAEITAPGMAPMTVPLVAADDVARAGMLGRATGSLSYLIWGAPAT